jgi:mono/diheme cytochrome c family protein
MANRIAIAGGLVLSALVFWSAASATHGQKTPPREDYNSGAYLYRAFCASCHGDSGRGDGPVASLSEPRPADLTVLSERAGGVFPRARVMSALDGTSKLAGHDAPAMPNWSRVLRRTEGDDERVVRRRLEALVSHVESLQRHK